jgi:hypothetical protein
MSRGRVTRQATNDTLTDHQCWFSKDASVVADIAVGSCVEATINCSQIRTCSDYDDKIRVRGSAVLDAALDQIEPRESFQVFAFDTVVDRVNIESICQADPCRWNRADKAESCVLDDEGVGEDCVTASEFSESREE